jgi:ribonuclease R
MNTTTNSSFRTAKGTVAIHPDGFGFFSDTAKTAQVFVTQEMVSGLLPDDLVEVSWSDSIDKPRALSLTVVRRAPRTFAFVRKITAPGKGQWEPFSKWHVTLRTDLASPDLATAVREAKDGDIWVGRFDGRALSGPLLVKMSHCIGRTDTVKGIHSATLADANHPLEPLLFSDALSDSVTSREDWTLFPFITVDGASTKDFDDAVCMSVRPNGGWTMRVAIADVAAFVKENDPLDVSAKARGTSVYLPMDVRPMFPSVLSDDHCSLLAHQPRAVLGVTLSFDAKGRPVDAPVFCHATIRVARRCLFEEVEHWINGKPMPTDTSPAILNVLTMWRDWMNAFIATENMPFPWRNSEHTIVIDDALNVSCVSIMATPQASRLVEMAMVSANRAAAQFLMSTYGAGLFRNHAEPQWHLGGDALAQEGWRLPFPSEHEPNAWWKSMFETYKGKPESWVLARAWSRMQQKASYEAANQGHHALGANAYTHFTSPIRRYADLVVHRAIHAALDGRPFDVAAWEPVLALCNTANSRARSVEREVKGRWMARWWSDQPKDKLFWGTIKSLKKNGSAMIQTDDFASHALLMPSHYVPSNTWTVGQRIQFKRQKIEQSSLTFQAAEERRG